MTERDERDEEPVSAESAELIRAHAELKKMVRTGEDLLYWNHTSGQRPLTRDERKERREARRVNPEDARPIWHDTDVDPGAEVNEGRAEGRIGANPPGSEYVAMGDGSDLTSHAASTEPGDDARGMSDRDALLDLEIHDETPARLLEQTLDLPFSGLWPRLLRAKVAVGAAVVTILVGGMIASFAPGARAPAASRPTATAIEVAERHVAPRGSKPLVSERVMQPAERASTATAVSPALVESSSPARSSALPERVPRVSPRRPVQAPRGARPPSASRPDLPGSIDPSASLAPPAAASPADRDSVANPDYDLLVPEIRQP